MAFALTGEQAVAVAAEGGPILVAAAAGSGKTRVLVERLLTKVDEKGVDVNRFLVITFTNDAAAELKHRIGQELKDRLSEMDRGVERERYGHLKRQLSLLQQAHISTIDGFCSELVRENAHMISVNPSFRQLTAEESLIIQGEVLTGVLSKWYEGGNEDFLDLVDTLAAGRDDRTLRQIVLDIYRKVLSHDDPETWLEEQKNIWDLSQCTEMKDTIWGGMLISLLVKEVRYHLTQIKRVYELCQGDEALLEKYCPALESDISALMALENALVSLEEEGGSWDDVIFVYEEKFEKFASFKGVKNADEVVQEIAKEVRKKMKGWVEHFPVQGRNAEVLGDLRNVSPSVCCLMDVVTSFMKAFSLEKDRRNVLDFADLEHFAVKLLLDENRNPSEVAKKVGAQFTEVMVDEYQDTNNVQNEIFSAVSQGEENLFLVGDVKQAIYSFRLASPENFARRFAEGREAETAGQSLMLSCNFRSRPEVLDSCNDFFKSVMTMELGGTDYLNDGMLVVGNPDGFPQAEEGNPYLTEVDFLDMSDVDFDLVEDKHEVEAQFIARRVGELIHSGFQVMDEEDKSGKSFRAVRPSDIMILLRSYSSVLPFYQKAMEKEGIPVELPGGEEIFGSAEVSTVISFLRVIDNPLGDVPLVGVLSSPLFGFTPDEIVILRQGQGERIFQAFSTKMWWFEESEEIPEEETKEQLEKREKRETEGKKLLSEGYVGKFGRFLCKEEQKEMLLTLVEKRDEFLSVLGEMRQAAWEKTPRELLWHLYEKCNVMGIFGSMDDGEVRQGHLLEFYRIFGELEDGGHGTLFPCLRHLDQLREINKLPKGNMSLSGEDAVSMMSIHKSKGLEKPVVFVGGLMKKYNTQNQKEPMLFHEKYGVGPNGLERERRIRVKTLARIGISNCIQQEMVAEELRLLYVAMTRAKEKLILTLGLQKGMKELESLRKQVTLPLENTCFYEQSALGKIFILYGMTHPDGGILWGSDTTARVTDATAVSRWDVKRVDCAEYLGLGEKEESEEGEENTPLNENSGETSNSGVREEEVVEVSEETKEIYRKRWQWVYDHAGDVLVPSKMTATQTKGRILVSEVVEEAVVHGGVSYEDFEELEAKEEIQEIQEKSEEMSYRRMDKLEPSFVKKGAETMDAAQQGIAIHLVMQYLDLPSLKGVAEEELPSLLEERIASLVAGNKITKAQSSVVSVKQIISFLESEWGKGAMGAVRCQQEFKFSMLMEASFFGFDSEESILLQGVMDCWYEDAEGNLVIIDFKSDKIWESQYEKKAKEHENQMQTYGEALYRMTGKKTEKGKIRKILWFFKGDVGLEVKTV